MNHLVAGIILVSLSAVASGSCSSGVTQEGGASLPNHRVLSATDVCASCIRLLAVDTLGESEGAGYLLEVQDVVHDPQGRYWVAHAGSLKIFGPDGEFLHEVGREGAGPGEYVTPRPLFLDSFSRVHVFDLPNVRVTVLDTAFAVVDMYPLPGPIERAEYVGEGAYVANAWLTDPDHIGLPVHLLSREELLNSFGENSMRDRGEADPFTIRRSLAVDREGKVFAARQHDYVIDVWNRRGEYLGSYELPNLNRQAPLPGPIARDNPYPTTIRDIHLDSVGRLWVLLWEPRANWMDHMLEVQRPDGDIVLQRKPGTSTADLWRGRIDVIDTATAMVVGRQRQDTLLARFLSETLVWAPTYNEAGAPFISVWRIGIEGV